MKIIYEDNEKIIVYKPAGKLTQGNRSFDVDLTSEVMTYRRKKGEEPYAAVINRLDRPVSGLVLFAKNKPAAAKLSAQLQKKMFCKQYEALICGKLTEESGTFVDYLRKDPVSNLSSVVDVQKNQEENQQTKDDLIGKNDCKRAELHYQTKKVYEDANGRIFTLVAIELITGRHHQIRAQFSSRDLPLFGDVKYGGLPSESLQLKELIDESDDKCMEIRVRIKRSEIALCSVSLTVDGDTYRCNPEWM